MTKNNTGRNRWHGATLKTTASRNHTAIHSDINAAIVRLAIWGVIPAGLATRLIQRGGLKDA